MLYALDFSDFPAFRLKPGLLYKLLTRLLLIINLCRKKVRKVIGGENHDPEDKLNQFWFNYGQREDL